MKLNEKILAKKNKIAKQESELVTIEVAILDKADMDMKNYGVELGNSALKIKEMNKRRAITKSKEQLKTLEDLLNKKHSLSKRDMRVLSAIRNTTTIANTTASVEGSRYDSRFVGSANSRKTAKQHWRNNE